MIIAKIIPCHTSLTPLQWLTRRLPRKVWRQCSAVHDNQTFRLVILSMLLALYVTLLFSCLRKNSFRRVLVNETQKHFFIILVFPWQYYNFMVMLIYVCAHMYFYIHRSRSQTFWSRKHRGIGLVILVIIHLLSSFIQWRTLVWLFLFLFSVFGRFCFCFGKAARFVSTLMYRFVRHVCAHYWYVIRTCALVKHCRCLCVLSSLVDVLFFYEMPWTDSRQERSLSDLSADVHIFIDLC